MDFQNNLYGLCLVMLGLIYSSPGASAADCLISEPALLPQCTELSGQDDDADGVSNGRDNCRLTPNRMQIDTDHDGFGNACDTDLNGDGTTNFTDLTIFRSSFSTGGETDTDFNGDNKTDFVDFWQFWQWLGRPPGPSYISCLDVVDVTDHGIVADDPSKAKSNTAIFRSLVSPQEYGGSADAVVRTIVFPGGRYYHFDDVIPFRFDALTKVDLRGSTLKFSKIGEFSDRGTGFIFVLGKLLLENGQIEVDYDATDAPVHAGAAIMLGTRSSAGSTSYFKDIWDGDLDDRMGDITLRNLHITSNNDPANLAFASRGILMLGGLQNVCMESVSIDGQGKMDHGIAYEFGFGAKPVTPSSEASSPDAKGHPGESSHANDMVFKDISITNLSQGVPGNPCGADTTLCDVSQVAIRFGGAYNVLVDGLKVDGAEIGFQADTGESLFFYPWGEIPASQDRVVTLKNADIRNTDLAINLSGSSAPTGYLRRWSSDIGPQERTDLLNFQLTNINLIGGETGVGISCAGSGFKLTSEQSRNRISGFWNSLRADAECVHIEIEDTEVVGAASVGLRMDFNAGRHYTSRRRKHGHVKNCTIRNNGIYGITIDYTKDFSIMDTTFGGENEASQVAAVLVSRPDKHAAVVEPVAELCTNLSQPDCAQNNQCVWSASPNQSCTFRELQIERNTVLGMEGSGAPFIAREDKNLYGSMVLKNNSPDNVGRGPWIIERD